MYCKCPINAEMDNMKAYTVKVSLAATEKYDGLFEFDNLDAAVEKVNSNIDTECTVADAQDGLDIYEAVHYFDRFDGSGCVIRKGISNMDKQQVIKQVEEWVKAGILSFDDLYTLSGQAYAKESSNDSQ